MKRQGPGTVVPGPTAKGDNPGCGRAEYLGQGILVLQEAAETAVVMQQRVLILCPRRPDTPDDDHVVSAVVASERVALEERGCAGDQRSGRGLLEVEAGELVGALRGVARGDVRLPALLTLLVTGGFLTAYLLRSSYGGSMVHSDGSEKLVLGISIGVVGFGAAIALSLIALVLDRRRRMAAAAG